LPEILKLHYINPKTEKQYNFPAMKAKLNKDQRNKEVNHGGDLYPVMQSILMRESKIRRAIEHFWVARLDNKNRLLK
jgi:hypothetical protein